MMTKNGADKGKGPVAEQMYGEPWTSRQSGAARPSLGAAERRGRTAAGTDFAGSCCPGFFSCRYQPFR